MPKTLIDSRETSWSMKRKSRQFIVTAAIHLFSFKFMREDDLNSPV